MFDARGSPTLGMRGVNNDLSWIVMFLHEGLKIDSGWTTPVSFTLDS